MIVIKYKSELKMFFKTKILTDDVRYLFEFIKVRLMNNISIFYTFGDLVFCQLKCLISSCEYIRCWFIPCDTRYNSKFV